MSDKNVENILEQRSDLANTGVTFVKGWDETYHLMYSALCHYALKSFIFFQSRTIQKTDELVFQL